MVKREGKRERQNQGENKEAEGGRPREMVFKDTWTSHLWDESLLRKPRFYLYHQIRDHAKQLLVISEWDVTLQILEFCRAHGFTESLRCGRQWRRQMTLTIPLLKVTLILAKVPQEAGSEVEIHVCRCLGVCPWEKLIKEARLDIFSVISAKVSVHP